MSAGPFEARAAEYDAWYDRPAGRDLLRIEAACLRTFPVEPPALEVGVGSGRFAEALGIDVGLDLAASALRLAAARGVVAVQGAAERLPFRDASFRTVCLVFALSVLDDPDQGLREARRALAPGGRLLLAFIPAGTAWAAHSMERSGGPDGFFRDARLRAAADWEGRLEAAGFAVEGRRSTLRQGPGLARYAPEAPAEGIAPGAGLICLLCRPVP